MLRGVLSGGLLFHGSRVAGLTELRPSTGGEFGPGIYLTDFEPTAWFYAKHVARGPGAPCVYVVRAQLVNPFTVTKTEWIRLTTRSSPKTVQTRLKKQGHDSIIGIALNGYEKQYVVFESAQAAIEGVRVES